MITPEKLRRLKLLCANWRVYHIIAHEGDFDITDNFTLSDLEELFELAEKGLNISGQERDQGKAHRRA